MRRGLALVLDLALFFCSLPALAQPGPAPLVAFKAGLPEETNYIEVALVRWPEFAALAGLKEEQAHLIQNHFRKLESM